MSIGFRPTDEDNAIIQAHKRPAESTADVLRRALRALDRERWEVQARADMERIAVSGEDLSDEPDDWGYDDEGEFVDLRDDARSAKEHQVEGSRASIFGSTSKAEPHVPLSDVSIQGDNSNFSVKHLPAPVADDLSWFVGGVQEPLKSAAVNVKRAANLVKGGQYLGLIGGIGPEYAATLRTAVGLGKMDDEYAALLRASTELGQQVESTVGHLPSRHSPASLKDAAQHHFPVPPKLARLRAAAYRRAIKK